MGGYWTLRIVPPSTCSVAPLMYPASGLARYATAEALVACTDPAAAQLSPFQLMLRSASNPRAAEIMRDAISRHVGARLTNLLDGVDADQRAELILALISGVWLLRDVIATPALTSADPARLTERLIGALQALSDTGPTGASS